MDQSDRSISEKYSLDYYRHLLPTRAWKLRWNLLALIVAMLAIGGMYLFGGKTAYQAAPVASVHSSFGTSCSACHTESWGAARRLATLDSGPRSVPNAACIACHPAEPHTLAMKQSDEPHCAECHQEHRPESDLTRLADSACIQCHQDLAVVPAADVSFVSAIRQFDAGTGGHPEFALLRSSALGKSMSSPHQAPLVAAFDANERKWLDRGGLKFNHKHHLHIDGLKVDWQTEPFVLGCANCHVASDDGYMLPINYEQHCQKCHPLALAEPFGDLKTLPHASAEEVRGVIRERLARRIGKASEPVAAELQQLPRLPKPIRLSADQERQLADDMEQADHAIFGPEAKGACTKCHYLTPRDGTWPVLAENPAVVSEPKFTRTKEAPDIVPERWMRHAVFDHKAHRAVSCMECHAATTSERAQDILMPSIDVCRKCHGDAPTSQNASISADCVLCHTYHHELPSHHENSTGKHFHGVSIQGIDEGKALAPSIHSEQ
jgi:predicted CXXCH cytochrome family protein